MARIDVNIPWHLFEQEVHDATSRAVRASAHEVISEGSINIRERIPLHWRGGKPVTDLVDTGAFLNSGYVITGDGENERGRAVAEATAAQPGVEIGIPDPVPNGDLEAQANWAVGYAEYLEARYLWLLPAAEVVQRKVEAILAGELRKEGF